MDLKVKLYTTPTCNGCKAIKQSIKNSKYAEYFEKVDLTKNTEDLDFLRDNFVMSVPAIGVFYKEKFFSLIGNRPIEIIDEFITECIRY